MGSEPPARDNFLLFGDDDELKHVFADLAARRHGCQPSQDGAQGSRFVVFLGTDARAAVECETTHAQNARNGFVFAGVLANEIVAADASDASSLAFVFSGAKRVPCGRHLSDVLGSFSPSPSTGGLLSVLLAEEARRDGEAPADISVQDVKLLVASAALAACVDDVVRKRPGEQWEILRFDQCPPRTAKPRAKKRAVCVFGCGILGTEFGRRFASRCPPSVDRAVFVDPSTVTMWDARHYFRNEEVGSSKAAIAARVFSASLKNPVTVQSVRMCVQEASRNEQAVKKIMGDTDLWVNCLSSVGVSRIIAQASVEFAKPVVDVALFSSDDGSSCGQVRTYFPHLTESMNCQHESSPDSQPPLCVVASFPHEPLDAIYWALDKLVKTWLKVVKEGRVFTLEECVGRARCLFEKWYNFRIRRLLRTFPADMKGPDGRLYWTYPKMCPSVLKFETGDKDHVKFVRFMGQFLATTRGAVSGSEDIGHAFDDPVAKEVLSMSDEQLVDILAHVPVPDFETEELKAQKRAIDDDMTKTYDASSIYGRRTALIKDEPNSLNIIAAVARLRCRSYGITVPEDDELLKQLGWEVASGHALCDAASAAVAAGFAAAAAQAALELMDARGTDPVANGNSCDKSGELFNYAFSLAPMSVQKWAPNAPAALLKVGSRTYTVWDHVKIKGSKTLSFGELCDQVARVFSQSSVSMVVQDKALLYMAGMTAAKTLSKLAQDVVRPPPPDASHVCLLFSFEAENGDGDDVMAPPVQFEWDYS